jgi:RNA polymerase sigma-70 factor, ECF subfamily
MNRDNAKKRRISVPNRVRDRCLSSSFAPTPECTTLLDGVDEVCGFRLISFNAMSEGVRASIAAERASTFHRAQAARNQRSVCRSVEEESADELLLKSVAEGDRAAMHILFARHRTELYQFIQRMVRNPGIANDLVGQVFLDVWRSANRLEGRAKVLKWRLSIARFKALCAPREYSYKAVDRDEVTGDTDVDEIAEGALERNETSKILCSCIESLSPAHREIVNWIYYRQKSIAEAGEVVGVSHATVKSRMFYARKQLAKVLVRASFEAAADLERQTLWRAAPEHDCAPATHDAHKPIVVLQESTP